MKFLLLILSVYSLLVASDTTTDDNWVFDRANFYIENDVYFGTDDGYSTGEMFTFLYFVPKTENTLFDVLGYKSEKTYSYATFSIANQMFTPTDTLNTQLIQNDRPYAGWTYLEAGMHKTTKTQLRSISLKIGVVGPSSLSEQLQREFHKTFDFDEVNGWDHQLKDELGVNLKFTQKWKYHSKDFGKYEGSFIPFTSAELGNIAINASAGFTTRFGYNIPKDYGLSTVNIGNDPGIPVYGEFKNRFNYPWSFSFNFTAAATAVGHDIFLDGNNFTSSHSVEKKILYGYYGVGFTARYKNLVLDVMAIEFSKQFKEQKESHGIGTAIVSWLY